MATTTRSNLQTRVITALVLAAVVLGTLFTGSTSAWAILVLVFCGASAWEWLRLGRSVPVVWRALGVIALSASLLVSAFALFQGRDDARQVMAWLLCATGVFWVFLVPLQLRRPLVELGAPLGWLAMPLVIGAAWVAAVVLQRQSTYLLIAVVVLTVAADVGGYFFGRAFGKHKLAPAISPGKTREGAVGGIVAASLWSVTAALSLHIVPATPMYIVLTAVAGAVLGMFAVMGDLYESQMKRQAGVKDSSNLLPGHGGVLDRIDAQLAVLPLATLLLHWVKPLW